MENFNCNFQVDSDFDSEPEYSCECSCHSEEEGDECGCDCNYESDDNFEPKRDFLILEIPNYPKYYMLENQQILHKEQFVKQSFNKRDGFFYVFLEKDNVLYKECVRTLYQSIFYPGREKQMAEIYYVYPRYNAL